MTIGPESFNNGSSKSDDRFGSQLGQYRPGGRRDATRAIASDTSTDLPPRNGTSMLDARGGQHDSRGGIRDSRGGTLEQRNGSHDARGAALDAAAPIASSIAPPKLQEPAMRDRGDHSDAMLASGTWMDHSGSSLVDHPLLRGLLMELPPKGTMPPPEYLDRWFEATRSILDLLYTMNARPSKDRA